MNPFLPEIHTLQVQVNGSQHRGSWYVLLGKVIVNYRDHTLTVSADPLPSEESLAALLRDLVAAHAVDLGQIPSAWPSDLRAAAHRYINSKEDESALADLLGNLAFDQTGWLCLDAASVVGPFWKELCDDNEPEQTLGELKLWMEDRSHSVNWTRVTMPSVATRGGRPIVDDDACRAEPIAVAVASTASFLQTEDKSSAIEALLSASAAHNEGCRPDELYASFEERLVKDLLPLVLAR